MVAEPTWRLRGPCRSAGPAARSDDIRCGKASSRRKVASRIAGTDQPLKSEDFVVAILGLEPRCPFERAILSRLRLPFRQTAKPSDHVAKGPRIVKGIPVSLMVGPPAAPVIRAGIPGWRAAHLQDWGGPDHVGACVTDRPQRRWGRLDETDAESVHIRDARCPVRSVGIRGRSAVGAGADANAMRPLLRLDALSFAGAFGGGSCGSPFRLA